jgi:hypothetical protein
MNLVRLCCKDLQKLKILKTKIKERRERYERVKVRGSNILKEIGYERLWELL